MLQGVRCVRAGVAYVVQGVTYKVQGTGYINVCGALERVNQCVARGGCVCEHVCGALERVNRCVHDCYRQLFYECYIQRERGHKGHKGHKGYPTV